MAERLKRPSLPPGPLDDLMRELHALYRMAGEPGSRVIASKTRPVVSHTTVVAILASGKLPKLPVMLGIVESLTTHVRRLSRPLDDICDQFAELWQFASDAVDGPLFVLEPRTPLQFTKSSWCVGDACIEVAVHPDGWIALRDSKIPDGAPFVFTATEFEAFTAGARAGEFDHLHKTSPTDESCHAASVTSSLLLTDQLALADARRRSARESAHPTKSGRAQPNSANGGPTSSVVINTATNVERPALRGFSFPVRSAQGPRES